MGPPLRTQPVSKLKCVELPSLFHLLAAYASLSVRTGDSERLGRMVVFVRQWSRQNGKDHGDDNEKDAGAVVCHSEEERLQ